MIFTNLDLDAQALNSILWLQEQQLISFVAIHDLVIYIYNISL